MTWLDEIYGAILDGVDRGALTPEDRAAARAVDPEFRQADDQWQAFMAALRAHQLAKQRGMLPVPPMPPAQYPRPQDIIDGTRRSGNYPPLTPSVGVRGITLGKRCE